jgi:hypothetical protein
MFIMTGHHNQHRFQASDMLRRSSYHLGTLVAGLVLTVVGVLGAVRTFDPVALGAAQVLFLVTTVVGVAVAMKARP